jgi:C_GCAxxG_C_C family probable redox protein
MSTKSDVAMELFLAGYNCAQSVLYAYAAELGLEDEPALKLATGLGAGMARCGQVCGAVSGGIMALSLKYGRGERQSPLAMEQTYEKTQELMARFEKQRGSCLCRVLLQGCDLRTAEGQRHFNQHDLLHKTCVPCVETAIAVVAELLETPPVSAGAATKPGVPL